MQLRNKISYRLQIDIPKKFLLRHDRSRRESTTKIADEI